MKLLETNIIHHGNASKLLKNAELFPDNSIDLIITSPPYANQRKKQYPSKNEKGYVNWFLNISEQMKRILKPRGSFILNIKENVKDIERQTYVYELVLKLKDQGWMWLEEYCWHKTNSFPGRWKNRFRDSWERCYHFSKNKNIKFYRNEVRVPIGDWSKKRFNGTNYKHDKTRHLSNTNSGFSRKVSNWEGKKEVDPDNVLYFSTVTYNRKHSAAFPLELPEWFIKLLTRKNNIVLDPFIGSGTTALAAKSLNRRYIGIDILKKNVNLANKRLIEEILQSQ